MTTDAADLGICTMCEMEPATTRWGLPVCQSCHDGLNETQAWLAEEEANDPVLADLGRKVEESAARFVAEQCPSSIPEASDG